MKLVKPGDPIENVIIQQTPVLEAIGITHSKLRGILDSFGNYCLIIFDGLDEHDIMNNEHILNLIKGQNYMKCNTLATSRPHNIVGVEEYFDVVVEVQGFNKNQTEQFVSKIVKDKGKQKSTLKFHDEIFIRGREKYAKPMLLLFVCILVNSDEINLESKRISLGEVYTRLVGLLYRKFVVRTGKKFSVTELVHLLKKVGKIVWETLQQKSSNDTEYNFLHKCELMNEVGEEAFECGFLVGHDDFRMIVLSDIVVTFPHRSIQEFLRRSIIP